jgi:hypothetical protein
MLRVLSLQTLPGGSGGTAQRRDDAVSVGESGSDRVGVHDVGLHEPDCTVQIRSKAVGVADDRRHLVALCHCLLD